jgi:hypothetical protein
MNKWCCREEQGGSSSGVWSREGVEMLALRKEKCLSCNTRAGVWLYIWSRRLLWIWCLLSDYVWMLCRSQVHEQFCVWNCAIWRITNFMELSPSREAAVCRATQEIPNISWNPKAHYSVYKRPPLVPIRRQINSALTTPSHVSKIHFIITSIYPPTSWPS